LLLNKRVIAFGAPNEVMRQENLAEAFGNSLLVMENGAMLVDECCPPDEDLPHDHPAKEIRHD
jgi:ABC-type cobalamin/Fe3+-siderophores transport system ATPase subunit